VLFLVDRGNLGRQTKKEFDQYASPYNSFKFGEEFIVQHLQGSQVDTSARVVICTIQRMFSLLKGKELPPEADEESTEGLESLFKDPEPLRYNPAFPIELFDIVVTDEAHRSIYNLWRQVLEYYDAYLVGLTATPNKQTFGFFNQNLVMEYGHAQAVADGENVNYDVYRIQTEVTERGAKVEKGFWLETVEKATRRKTAWQLTKTLNTTLPSWTAACKRPTKFAKSSPPFATNCPPRYSLAAPRCPRPWSLPKTTTTPKRLWKSCEKSLARATSLRKKSPTAPQGPSPKT
jgi:type I site-specific restriction endonuclease